MKLFKISFLHYSFSIQNLRHSSLFLPCLGVWVEYVGECLLPCGRMSGPTAGNTVIMKWMIYFTTYM